MCSSGTKPGGTNGETISVNNKAKGKLMTVLIVLGIAVLALILLGMFGVKIGGTQNTAVPGVGSSSSNPTIITSATTLNIRGSDGLQPGVTFSGTNYISTDGNPFMTGITTASPGQKISLLVQNGSAYHSAYVTGLTVPAAPTMDIPIQGYANASITMQIFNTNGVVVNNDGGATNQTVAVGGSYSMQLTIDGQNQKSTQDMVCIVEATNSTAVNANGIQISGTGVTSLGQAKPNFYTLQGAGSVVYLFGLPPANSPARQTYTLSVQSASAKTLTTSKAIVSCYTKEYFLDSGTGKVAYDIADSYGNQKSIAKYTTTVAFT